jgi:hypothetical protein
MPYSLSVRRSPPSALFLPVFLRFLLFELLLVLLVLALLLLLLLLLVECA